MTQKIESLKVLTVVRPGKRAKKVTDITIVVPGVNTVVARATFAGEWSEQAALAEFNRLPGRFKTEEEGLTIARNLRLAA